MPGKGLGTTKGGSAIPYAILRFEKHQGGSIRALEAHHERQKDSYASNPDIDTSRSPHNMHIVQPGGNYPAEVERRLQHVQGRAIRKDAVRLVDTIITAGPEMFHGWDTGQIRAFFQRAVDFMKVEIGESNIVSAVVHMDEKAPHMHLCFTPVTKDNRLCAKDILGNRKKLVEWQDKYHAYMVSEYPNLERGKPAQATGRKHVPTQLYKQAVHLDVQMEQILKHVEELKLTNIPKKREEIQAGITALIPQAEAYLTQVKSYQAAIERLRGENVQLAASLQEQGDYKMELLLLKKQVDKYKKIIHALPPEVRQNLSVKGNKRMREK